MNFLPSGKIKISTKVALSFIAIVLFQGVLTQVVTYGLVSRSNVESYRNRMYVTMEGMENYLSQVLDDVGNKVGLLSGQKNIIEYTEYRLRNLLSRELSLFNTALNMNGIYVVVDQGRLLAADENSRRLNEEILTTIVAKGYRQGKQSFMYDDGTGMYLFSLGQIVREDKVIGMIVARIAIDEDFISRLQKITSSKALIQFPDREILSAEIPESKIISLIEAASRMRPGDVKDAGDYLLGAISFENLGTISGRLISVLDMRESRNTIRVYNRYAFLLTFLVLIIALILSIIFYRQSFLRPYTALQEGVARIGNGDFSYPIQQTSGDEFGDLVHSVNSMRIKLLNRDRELTALINFNQLILNNVRSGIITLGHDGQINSCNASAVNIVHLYDNAALPLPLEEAGLPDEIKDLMKRGLKLGEYVTLKECRLTYNGREEILTLTTSPFSDGEGEELGLIAVIADVTQIKKLEEQLQISKRLASIGEMVAGVSHQLRNPLAIMKVSAEILRDNYGNNFGDAASQYLELTEMLVSEIDSLNYIIHNFLDFARPLHITRSIVSVRELIDSALSLLSRENYPGVALDVNVIPENALWNMDKDMMEQVIRNLVQNALEASGGKGSVSVVAEKQEDSLRIEVRDQGCGMDDKCMHSIFNPFFSKKDSGTGLGLSIVQRIILEHNGSIIADSEVGSGSVFTILL